MLLPVRTPTGTLLRAGLGVVLGLALVAGCSDEPKAGTIKPPRSTTTTSSASPTPATPEAEVEAAVRTYYGALTRGIQVSDTSRLRPLVTQGCPCFGAVRTIEDNAAKGRKGPGVRVRIGSIRIHDLKGNLAAAEVKYRVNAYALVNESGRVVSRIPARRDFVDLSMVKMQSGRWVVGNVFNLES